MDELSRQIYEFYPQVIDVIDVLGIVFAGLVLLELGYDWFYKRNQRDFKQSIVDLGVYVGHEFAGRFVSTLIFIAALNWVSRFSLFTFQVNAFSWVVCFVFGDFVYYWTHRLEHRIRFFWTWHSVHHSSHEFNGTTALRLAWLEPFVAWYSLVPAVLLGFDVIQVVVTFQILLTYQTWIHTKKIPYLGRFEYIFNSPSSHRVHHGSNQIYLDRNFGAVFIFWDRIFGTYQRETEPVTYGLTTPIDTNNPVKVNLLEPLNIWRGLAKATGFRAKVSWVFGALEVS